ncbi:g1871 [Coccomyxa viridis]|uniref:G1871 protein n=1 Tax=Coccomyxa viridis TaxID=1274662 RepID=A0ABP1FIZ6_9CHLO
MPLHRIYSVKGVFSADDKKAIAEGITNVYSAIPLPKFYVVVLFIDTDLDSFFIGGKPNDRFVRIVTGHIARTNIGAEKERMVLEALQAAYHPYVRDRGLDWEIHIEEHEREVWRENGLAPPMPGTDAEKYWIEVDKAVPYTKGEDARQYT